MSYSVVELVASSASDTSTRGAACCACCVRLLLLLVVVAVVCVHVGCVDEPVRANLLGGNVVDDDDDDDEAMVPGAARAMSAEREQFAGAEVPCSKAMGQISSSLVGCHRTAHALSCRGRERNAAMHMLAERS